MTGRPTIPRSLRGRVSVRTARALDRVYRCTRSRRRTRREAAPLEGHEWILCDLLMHTSWSHDCAVEPEDLVAYAQGLALRATEVTDHNVFGNALAAVEAALG